MHSGLLIPKERWTELEAGYLTCPQGSRDSWVYNVFLSGLDARIGTAWEC